MYLKSKGRHIFEEPSLLREYAETSFFLYRAWDTLLCMGEKAWKLSKETGVMSKATSIEHHSFRAALHLQKCKGIGRSQMTLKEQVKIHDKLRNPECGIFYRTTDLDSLTKSTS